MSEYLVESIGRYVGQTVTIFTESGGLSGSGFTGTLAGIFGGCVRLITAIGAAPACPIGSACVGSGFYEPYVGFSGGVVAPGVGVAAGVGVGVGCGGGCGCNGGGFYNNWLGSVCDIPICKIVCFTHTAI